MDHRVLLNNIQFSQSKHVAQRVGPSFIILVIIVVFIIIIIVVLLRFLIVILVISGILPVEVRQLLILTLLFRLAYI